MCNICSSEKGAVGAFVCFGSIVTTSLFLCVLNVAGELQQLQLL